MKTIKEVKWRNAEKFNIHRLFDMRKHGDRISFPFKGVLLGQVFVFTAGIFGAGLVGWFLSLKDGNFPWMNMLGRFMPGRKHSLDKLCFVPGLQNMGNNCFLNALASCCRFHAFLQNLIHADDSILEKRLEDMPLTASLFTLLEELSALRAERTISSPLKVMHAMSLYVSSFDLTRQQDAAEALLYLLSALKEEYIESCEPDGGSLADICSFSHRLHLSSKERESHHDRQRWQENFRGPFDGTLGSFLGCKRCSFQLSIDFEFFHCLPLSPVLDMDGEIVVGCTIDDCLRKLIAAEQIENYHCNHCFHMAAIKYFGLKMDGNEALIHKLRSCTNYDECKCKDILLQKGVPCFTNFSCVMKQLSIGRCPEILCIHLQRASVDEYGNSVKLLGHISFPPILHFFPYTAAGVSLGSEIPERNMVLDLKHRMCQQTPVVPCLDFHSGRLEGQAPYHNFSDVEDQTSMAAFYESGVDMAICEPFSHSYCTNASGSGDKGGGNGDSIAPKGYFYSLTSVVEHHGRPGSGHYTVYRRALVGSDEEALIHGQCGDEGKQLKKAEMYWYGISDSDVLRVPIERVLASEASLLFYEKTSIS
ncbi:ubiquitin carboxyl-terminal hydrolase 27 isoform X2 [Amborella trichopoda]|uniref:ubiquitin carboxyl-terminal hydrolase 27 isoform X2 n=1 Tax=Amborella trichopoda TaxID=13333 RepID=UPI0009BCF957|nr:ubiquitin carboxyl-terminal hydrolase 27 isoform X2 [Amborella trichopoda]|eukprot:XP_020524493.1 ubiquitin carboxyl-terminal hydrolase 27 isoform X2 [Amborella trichopoda]